MLIQHGKVEYEPNSRYYTELTPDELINNALKFKVTVHDLEEYRKEYNEQTLFRQNLNFYIVCFTRLNGYSAGRQHRMRVC